MAYDLRLMMDRIQQVGQFPAEGAVQNLEKILGRPMRTYRAFVAERVKKDWLAADVWDDRKRKYASQRHATPVSMQPQAVVPPVVDDLFEAAARSRRAARR